MCTVSMFHVIALYLDFEINIYVEKFDFNYLIEMKIKFVMFSVYSY